MTVVLRRVRKYYY